MPSLFHSPTRRTRHRPVREAEQLRAESGRAFRYQRAQASTERKPGPCCVYLFVHLNQARFKIGLSLLPRNRAQQLPEANSIDYGRSIQVLFPSRTRAKQIESMLHNALAAFRLRMLGEDGEAWDGSTEWFDMAGLHCAIHLLRITPPTSDLLLPTRLTDLQGKACQGALVARTTGVAEVVGPAEPSEAERRQQLMAEANLERMALIGRVLATLAAHLVVRWYPAQGGSRNGPDKRLPARLCIQGLRSNWRPELLKARFEVFSSELWQLQSAQARRGGFSLVSVIQYRQDQPETLELLLNDSGKIGRLPGGRRALEMWRAICESYQ